MPELKMYNANDGLTGRPSDGVYLDLVEARRAEEDRARREGREPNYDEFQPYVGTQLVNETNLIMHGQGLAIPSETDRLYEVNKGGGILAEPVTTQTFADLPEYKGGDFLKTHPDAKRDEVEVTEDESEANDTPPLFG